MNAKTRIAGVLVAGAALILTGCAGGGGAQPGKTEITYLSWETEEIMEPVIDAFEKANPDITVKASYAPPVNEYIQALQTRILSGTAPDVFIIAAENKTNLIEAGAVLDLADEEFVDVMPEFNRLAYGEGDAVYGLSVASWGAGMMYNVDLLAEVGYDTVPQDWEEFLELCHALKDAGITPYFEVVDGIPFLVHAFLGSYSESIDGEMDDLIFSGESSFEEQWTPSLEQYYRLFEEGLVSTDVVGVTGDQVRSEFINGRIAMMPSGPWFIDQMRENPDLNFAMTPMPAVGDTRPFVAGAAGVGYAINSKSDKIDAATEFLAYLASPEGMEVYQESSNAITITTNFEPTLDESLDPVLPAIRNGDLYLAQIAWQRAEDVLNVEAVAQMQLMVQGEVTPAEAAAALDRKLADFK